MPTKKQRPDYTLQDEDERYAQLSSREDILPKSFISELWTKVIERAIDDIIIYYSKEINGKVLSNEEEELKESAIRFLFDDDYLFPMDDYLVEVCCIGCSEKWDKLKSDVVCYDTKCPKCNHVTSSKTTQYEFLQDQKIYEMNLRELLSLRGIENIEAFRNGVTNKINEAVEQRTKTKGNKMVKENFKMPTEDELTEFDKGIARVLEEAKILLMQKNRKYGNSATKPVRAFSKADPIEQIKVRIDDKISRIVRGDVDIEDEDVIQDLLGYLTILRAMQCGYIK